MIHTAVSPALDAALADYLRRFRPDSPFYIYSERALTQTARRFQAGFKGLVTYAVKANDSAAVLQCLSDAGLRAFDVASIPEMHSVLACAPDAALHYNNPVRSAGEVAAAKALDVRSYSVDSMDSLNRLGPLDAGTEISVRLALPVAGAEYDFGDKFGACPDTAQALLRAVAQRGLTPSMTFHPGTQCERAQAWESYITACAQIAQRAGVQLARLNVGGGFAAQRGAAPQDLAAVFDVIAQATARAFTARPPALVCEPGRAMVAEALTLVLRVKWRRGSDGALFMNDGIYGALCEARDIGLGARLRWIGADGLAKTGQPVPAILFGPTCDSLDRIPQEVPVPGAVTDGDYLVLAGAGAYSRVLSTRFNGYGTCTIVDEASLLSGHCLHAD